MALRRWVSTSKRHPIGRSRRLRKERRQRAVGLAQLGQRPALTQRGDRDLQVLAADGAQDCDRGLFAETLQRLARARDDKPAGALAKERRPDVLGVAEVQ